MFTRDDLETLLATDADPAVSIYIPTHEAGREIRQDAIRMRNRLSEAKARLVERGVRAPDADALLRPGYELLDEGRFWRHPRRGLALFLARDFARHHRLPVPMPEEVVVGARFHLKHLIPVLADDGRFLVLAVAAGSVRLFEGSRHGLAELEHNWPASVAEVSGETDYENTLHRSPVTRPRTNIPRQAVASHNFGEDPEELRHALLVEFLRRLAAGVDARFGSERAPLVLAAQPKVQGHLRNLLQLDALAPEGIDVDPEAVDEGVLHARAYGVVKPGFEARRSEALAHFRGLHGDGSDRAVTTVEDGLRAARYGQVDSLLVTEGARLWGHHDPATDRVRARSEPGADAVDLVDLAAAETLRHGGAVFFVPEGALPPGSLLAAVLRYGPVAGPVPPAAA